MFKIKLLHVPNAHNWNAYVDQNPGILDADITYLNDGSCIILNAIIAGEPSYITDPDKYFKVLQPLDIVKERLK